MKIIFYLCSFIQIVLAVALVGIIAIQESKSEGLTGQIGTTVSSSFKGLAGKDEKLGQLTRNLGIGFFVVSLIVAVTSNR